MEQKKTFYDILGVSPKCSTEEIRVAYRKLVQRFHPDKCNEKKENLEKLMIVINCAYRTLSNVGERLKYDAQLKLLKQKKDDFMTLKNGFIEFAPTMTIDGEKKKRAQIDFDNAMKLINMNQQQNLVDTTSVLDKLKTTEITREQETIEDLPANPFKDKQVSQEEFNKWFDSCIPKNDNMIKYTGDVQPFNVDNTNCQLYRPVAPNNNDNVLTDMNGNPIENILQPCSVKSYINTKVSQDDFDKLLADKTLMRTTETTELGKIKSDIKDSILNGNS